MSWHYLQGREVACWDPHSLDGVPSALLKLIPTADLSYCSDKKTAASRSFRSGMTSAPLMDRNGEDTLTSYQEDFPVRTSAVLVRAKDLPAAVRVFGSKCCELLAKYNLHMSSRKTRRICVPVDLAPSSRDLPAWGMTSDGGCWELGTSVRPTAETVCGSLPSPRHSDADKGGRGDLLQAYRGNCNKHFKAHFPTLTTTGNENSPLMQKWPAHRSLQQITNGAWISFREWMMGWPIGWTALEPLAMDKFHKWLRLHGKF